MHKQDCASHASLLRPPKAFTPPPESLAAVHTFQLVFNRWTVDAGVNTVLPQPFHATLKALLCKPGLQRDSIDAVSIRRPSLDDVCVSVDEIMTKCPSRFPIMRKLFGAVLR